MIRPVGFLVDGEGALVEFPGLGNLAALFGDISQAGQRGCYARMGGAEGCFKNSEGLFLQKLGAVEFA